MFLHDRPESSDIRFGHAVISDWLADEIKKAQPPIRLALTGGLGTGKSTILQAAIDKLVGEDKSIKRAYVDVWKLDKESVRRSAILKIAKDLRPDDYDQIEAIKESVYGTRVENAKPKLFQLYWNPSGLFFAIFVGLIIYGVTIVTLGLLISDAGAVKQAIAIITALLGVLFKVLEKSIINIQKTISKAPMVGAEEFEECLQAILDSSELKKSKTIITFDNIDRASPSSSRAILSGISAFFDHSKNKNVVIIVPFDPSCLQNDSNGERPLLDDCEKMFDAIIPLPKLTSEDLTDFALHHLRLALEGFSYTDGQLQDLAYLVSFSPYRSPREIKHMVNQLISRLNLAKSLESKKDSRLQTDSTLLPTGAITSHPECLLKFLICEKIYPLFTEILVTQGLDVAKSFEADPKSPLMSTIKDKNVISNLSEFLQATVGIPKNPPQSASAFLYMKGPDQILNIPSGQAISDAIYMGNGDSLKNVILPSEGTPVSQKDIANVIQYHRKKFAKNAQALKNSIRAITNGMSEIKNFEKPLSIEICEVFNLVPEILKETSPKWVNSLSQGFFDVSSINRVWRTLDAEFKSMTEASGDLKPTDLNWLVEYFISTYSQEGGIERSKVDTVKLPQQILFNENVYKIIGKDYPSTFATDETTIEAVKFYFTKTEDLFFDFVEKRFNLCGDENEIEKKYTELADLWKAATDGWLNSKDADGDVRNLANVLYYWPTSSKKAAPFLTQIKDWIVGKINNFNQKTNAGFGSDVIDICLSLYLNKIPADGNINSMIHHALGAISDKGLKNLILRYEDANTIWKTIFPQASPQLLQSIDRNKIFKDAIDPQSPILKNIVTGFAGWTNKEALLDALLEVNVIPDIVVDLGEYYKHSTKNLRPKILKVYSKYKLSDEIITQTINAFIAAPDSSNLAVINEVESLSENLRKLAINQAITTLNGNTGQWADKEVQVLEWTSLGVDDILETNLKEFIDRVIDRGAQNGANDNVKKSCTDHVLKIWERNHGFTEKSFKILKKTAASDYDSRISALAEKHNVKDGIMGVLSNVAGKVLGEE